MGEISKSKEKTHLTTRNQRDLETGEVMLCQCTKPQTVRRLEYPWLLSIEIILDKSTMEKQNENYITIYIQ